MHASSPVPLPSSVPKDALIQKGNAYLYLPALVAAIGGFLFGFDTAVINGAIVFLKREFALTAMQTEMAASSLLLGCIVGASLAGWSGDRFGRKKALLAAAAFFGLSAIAAAVPHNLTEFVMARIVGGVAIGLASMLSPLYIAEISPAYIRGRLVSLNQLAIVCGILVSYLANFSLANLGPESWRWMFASAALPSLLFLLALLAVPESPRWLVQHGRSTEARTALTRISGANYAEEEMRILSDPPERETNSLWVPQMRRPMMIAISLAILQQITGINTILYYGSLLFVENIPQQTDSSSLAANVIIGLTNLVGTIVAIFLIDRAGRKPLLLAASAGMGVCLSALAISTGLHASSTFTLIWILLYVACFAIGLGPGVWVVLAEIFPNAVRAKAMSLAIIALWCACFLITSTFLSLINAISIGGTFSVYALLSFLTAGFVWKFVPETKGRTLEEIENFWLKLPVAESASSKSAN